MRIHFIAIGGSAMHNLAIALYKKGYTITGSDDEIFEPALSRLKNYGILPEQIGWFPEKISTELDAVILGMHARADNQELIKAQELGVKIFSYPEYLYDQTKDKTRVVVGGSHGKTTITSMIMHVLKHQNITFDYMVGAQVEGFDTMVNMSVESQVAVFEGDEYLTSPIDLRPKFHLYKPNIAVLSGIAWDHINVFPTFENYVEQFKIFVETIEKNGSLIYFEPDENLRQIAQNTSNKIDAIAYNTPKYEIHGSVSYLLDADKKYSLQIFGEHNIQNCNAARLVCNRLGISDNNFYEAIQHFKGAAKRLQKMAENESTTVFLDFAHSPSKLQATTKAAKAQFQSRNLVACMELHTFSSLNVKFLPMYFNTMESADVAVVYFNPKTIQHKRLQEISVEQVAKSFHHNNIRVFINSEELLEYLRKINWENSNLLLMTSGNFDGIDLKQLAHNITQ